jgi:4'-phosphopantetheinyl transferase EntD
MSLAMAESLLMSRDAVFPLAFQFEDARFGTCAGVHLPPPGSVEAAALLAELHPEERDLCWSMRGARMVEFAGGRVASRLARAAMQHEPGPTLMGPHGVPEVQGGGISLSHTQRLAAALANPDLCHTVGVDIEAIDASPHGHELLAERILAPGEAPDIDIVQRLSIKEAAYKAIFALTGMHLPLRDIAVMRDSQGFRIPIPALEVEAKSIRIEGHYLSLGRARRMPPSAKAIKFSD